MRPSPVRLQLFVLCVIATLGATRTLHRAAPEPVRHLSVGHAGICVAYDGFQHIARLCSSLDAVATSYFAPPAVRAAQGLPPCWFTVDAAILEALPAVGARAAETIVEHRNANGALDFSALVALDNVGPRAAAAIVAASTTQCARVSGALPGWGFGAPIESSRW